MLDLNLTEFSFTTSSKLKNCSRYNEIGDDFCLKQAGWL